MQKSATLPSKLAKCHTPGRLTQVLKCYQNDLSAANSLIELNLVLFPVLLKHFPRFGPNLTNHLQKII